MMRATVVLWIALLAGCETFRPLPPAPQSVTLPVAAACLPAALPARPRLLTDAELAKLDEYDLPVRLFIERERLRFYADDLEAVLKACR